MLLVLVLSRFCPSLYLPDLESASCMSSYVDVVLVYDLMRPDNHMLTTTVHGWVSGRHTTELTLVYQAPLCGPCAAKFAARFAVRR